MAIIKKYSPFQNLGSYSVFIDDTDADSLYFNITELEKTLTGGKNAFLFEGSPYLKKGSKIRFEALDVEGDTLYIEPGVQAGKTFKDGTSIVMAIHIYDDTPIGIGSLQITAELDTYIDNKGIEKQVPIEFRDRPNIRWTQTFKVNPKIPNKTQVRFFKRPTFSVTEIEKPLLVKTNTSLSKSGSIIGIPEVPATGSDFSNWTTPSQYRIKLQEGNKFTQSMDENTTLVVDSLGYSSSVLEVLNEDEMLVRKPYLKDNIVNEFTPVSYSMDFESVEDASVNTGSNVVASYAEVRLENLKTFTGDVARIKIFRKSRNDLGDFQVVQENKLDATELLRDFSVPNRTVINYGKLRKENIVSDVGDVYYTTSSGVKVHNQHLINSLLVSSSHTVESNGTIGEFQIVSGSEYSLSYKSKFIGLGNTSASFADSNTLEFLLVTSSNNTTNTTVTTQSIDIQTGSNEIGPPVGVKFKSGSGEAEFFHTEHDGCGVGNQQNVTKNFFAEINGKCQIRVKADTQVNGVNNFPTGSFVFGTLSLKNAEESSYSPDEYTAIVDIPRKNPTEQFDFRVEFYDINNNFIPIKIEQSVPFTKGNQSRILETAVLVSASGVADAGDILNVDAAGVVQIASTNIQSSTIAGLGNPTLFSANVAASTQSLQTQTTALDSKQTELSVSSSILTTSASQAASSTDSLNDFTSSFNTAIALNSDDVTIKGDLTVQGTSTALDTTTLNVKDLNILVASGAADSNAADGAGITIDGANESITWSHANSRFNISDDLNVDGNITLEGDLPILTELNSFSASITDYAGVSSSITPFTINVNNIHTTTQSLEQRVGQIEFNTGSYSGGGGSSPGTISGSDQLTGSFLEILGDGVISSSQGIKDAMLGEELRMGGSTVATSTTFGDLEVAGGATVGANLFLVGQLNIDMNNIDGSTAEGLFISRSNAGQFGVQNEGVLVGTTGSSNLYLGNFIAPNSSDKGARFHSDNNDFFFDFQGDATQHFFFRDYDGSGGIHTRFTFDFIDGIISSSGGFYSAGTLNTAGDVMLGGNLSVTGSIGNTSVGPLGNYPGRVKVSSSLQGHTQYITGDLDPTTNQRVYAVDLRKGNYFHVKLCEPADGTNKLVITSSNEGQVSYILTEQSAANPQSMEPGESNMLFDNGNALGVTQTIHAKDLFKVITFNSGSTPFMCFITKEISNAQTI